MYIRIRTCIHKYVHAPAGVGGVPRLSACSAVSCSGNTVSFTDVVAVSETEGALMRSSLNSSSTGVSAHKRDMRKMRTGVSAYQQMHPNRYLCTDIEDT